MCGIAFAIRSSTSYRASGLPPASVALDAGSPGSTGSAGSPGGMELDLIDEDDPDYGIKMPDGSKPAKYLDANETWEEVVDAVKGRGPDVSNTLIKHVKASKAFHFEMRFHASVLHMRGDVVTPQPFVSKDGDVLLWNGEIFDGLEVGEHENDGQKLFDRIQAFGPSNFFAAIRDVEGPYAFVYFQASNSRLYFGRDPLGRRSLLVHAPTPASPYLFLVSNAPGADFPLQEWEEVSCEAVHCYHLLDLKGKSWSVDGRRGLSSYPRYPKSMGLSQDILVYPYDRLNSSLPAPGTLLPMTPTTPPEPVFTSHLALLVQSLLSELETAVRARVSTVPPVPPPPEARIAVLFSGGLDCSVIALVLDRVLPEGEAVDLINVAFENPRKLKAKEWSKGKAKSSPANDDVMDVDDARGNGMVSEPSEATARNPKTYDVPDRLTARDAWEELKRLRPKRRWNLVEVDVPYQEMLAHRQTVINLMRPQNTVMDLSISIAFYFAARGKGHLSGYSSSDPSPPSDPPTSYHSSARVLLTGLGADELLAGYARHRKAFAQPNVSTPPPPPPKATFSIASSSYFSSGGSSGTTALASEATPPDHVDSPQNWSALIAELQLDLDRLPTRNLGRDDRIISIHGKEARYPFLAGHVVAFLARQPVWYKADLRFSEGIGDKMLLRLLAKRLGLKDAAVRKKRAIHFGAQTAKMEFGDGRLKGTDLLTI